MNKALKYTLGGAAIAGCGNGLINVLSQLSDPDPNRKFDWDSLFIAFIKGVAIGGGTGFLIGTLRDKEMSDTLNAIGGISFVIEQALTDYTDDCTILNQKAAKLQRLLYNEFQDSLTEYPTIRGSIERGTAIAGSDVDIQLKFYKGAIFLDEMWNLVDCFLREKFADVHFESMREQEYSTGLFFRINGELKRIDIVCGRELDNGQGDMFIYSKRSESWRKTNAQKQGLALKFTEKQRSIVKLLKIWKKENNLKIPSVFIEHLVKRAFAERKIARGLENGLMDVLDYIGSKITSIRVIDCANSNNVISDTLDRYEKEEISKFCFAMLEDVGKDERNILDYFQVA